MNVKEILKSIKEIIVQKQDFEKYKAFVKEMLSGNNVELTEEQFNYLKELYLKEGYIIGLHNTYSPDINSFF